MASGCCGCTAPLTAPAAVLVAMRLQATAAGVKETEATNMLEKKFRSGPQYSRKEVVELAISVLQVQGGARGKQRRRVGRAARAVHTCLLRGPAAAARLAAARLTAAPRSRPNLSQHVLGEDLKASDIEVGVASAADGGRFRVLSSAELDEHLVAISERD